jgi:hypothetical protein
MNWSAAPLAAPSAAPRGGASEAREPIRYAGGEKMPIDQITLRNRLLVATSMWRETIAEPLPRMPPGDPADQIQSFEITLVDRLWQSATAESAREIADRTWDLVHDRPDNDPVKRRVVECHEALARMTRLGD